MSLLWWVADTDATKTLLKTRDPEEIRRGLGARGVRFEQWRASVALPAGADQEAILHAYDADVARLKREGGYQSVDVVRLTRADADDASFLEKAKAARQKFLREHTHDEDEVRFFVEGSGLFYLRLDDTVAMMLCERGDLLSVPAGTRHWFDMGSEPSFCAIRLFTRPDGWVARFTESDIHARFPSFDELVAR